jgi:hypothetical protein
MSGNPNNVIFTEKESASGRQEDLTKLEIQKLGAKL